MLGSVAYSDDAGLCFHYGLGYLQSVIIEVRSKISELLIHFDSYEVKLLSRIKVKMLTLHWTSWFVITVRGTLMLFV